MTSAMRHRGPDGDGFMTAPGIALGMRRLQVIDLVTGDQPIFNRACAESRGDDQAVAIIFNGEIYNYRDLQNELQGLGHRFVTRSDTEAIVHAYEEWGADCVHRLRGMFAFAIHDRKQSTNGGSASGPARFDGRLFLARDRIGIKPLYFYRSEDVFLFASEVRSLLSSGLVPRQLSLEGLVSYLGYGSVQEPLSMVDGVYSLSPGHRMTVSANGDDRPGAGGPFHVAMDRYWDFPDQDHELDRRDADAPEQVEALLEEAVRLRLIADVPLGAFLSGGIDSGAVVGLMSRVEPVRAKTFTVTFDERQFSEARLAKLTAERFNTDHTEVRVTGSQVLAELPQALAAMDQPTVDGINTYFVSQAARSARVTVALSGLGGDEIFAGYDTFGTVPRMRTWQRRTGWLPSGVGRGLGALLSMAPVPRMPDVRRKVSALLANDLPFSDPYFLARSLYTPQAAAPLLATGASSCASEDGPWRRRVSETLGRAQAYDAINSVSYLESTHYLVSTLLRDTDQMSMAHSLEVRVPLADHELVEFMLRLPGQLKAEGPRLLNRPSKRTPKHLLVQALNGAIPDEVVHREKSTFTFPWERWLAGELADEVKSSLDHLPQALEGVVDTKAVAAVWQQFMRGRTSWSRPWSLYVMSKWVDRELG